MKYVIKIATKDAYAYLDYENDKPMFVLFEEDVKTAVFDKFVDAEHKAQEIEQRPNDYWDVMCDRPDMIVRAIVVKTKD